MELKIEKVKIFVTIPVENVEEIRNAICEAGAGIIGNYTFCTTSVKSTGTFIPNSDANPYIGEKNKYDII